MAALRAAPHYANTKKKGRTKRAGGAPAPGDSGLRKCSIREFREDAVQKSTFKAYLHREN